MQIQEILNIILNDGISLFIVAIFFYQYLKRDNDTKEIIKKLDEIIMLLKMYIEKK